MIRIILAALVLLIGSPALSQTHVIAHRGASGERPEHTAQAYELAIDQGADAIEPDLVMSRDGVLVVRHENEIGQTTDVAERPEFAPRRTTRSIDGQVVTGWFTEDFTLAELKRLRTRERLPLLRPANVAFDGQGTILTFQEVIDIARAGSARTGRTIRLTPELKHPGHFAAAGLAMEAPLLAVLAANDLAGKNAPLLIQCFEVGPLISLSQATDAPLLQLMTTTGGPADRPHMTYAQMTTPRGLAEVATYAHAIGVEATLVEPRDAAGAALPATTLVADAQAAGLEVVVWTLRAENHFLARGDQRGDPSRPDYLRAHGDMAAQVRRFQALGVDAVFSDFPGLAVAALKGR